MTSRERMMVLVLAVLALGGVGFGVFTLAVKPILTKRGELADLKDEVEKKTDGLRGLESRTRAKLEEYHRRGLPADVEFAKREYQELLERLLDEAKAPARGYTISADAGRASVAGVPLLNPTDPKDKTPAYTKVAYKVEIKRTDLGVVTDFLARYYKTNLLHQITLIEVKRDGQADLSEDKRPWRERDDLHVTLVTEAIILNGAPERKTILSIPPSNGAVLGAPALWSMEQTPSVGLAITPPVFEQILANKPERDYLLIAAKDPFHGTLPTPPLPKQVVVQEKTVPPKPDYGEFIAYTFRTVKTEGTEETAEVIIRDMINNEDYYVSLSRGGEKVKAVVKKYEYNTHRSDPAKRKTMLYDQNTLEISKYTMSNKRNFTVYGLDGDALVLGEKPSGLAELTKAASPPGGAGGRGGPNAGGRGGPNSTRTPLPPPDPQATVLGGAAAALAPRPEKIYRWEHGQKLSQIVELKGKEAEKAVQRAQSSLLVAAVEPTATAEK